MANLENTQYFNVKTDPEVRVKEVLDLVYNAMSEKGYNPVNQIVGYIMSGDPTYITSYKGARSTIMKVERDELVEELLDYEGPDARAKKGGRDAHTARDDARGDRGAEGLLELEVPRDDGLLDGVVRVHHQDEHERAQGPHHPGHAVEAGDGGGGEKHGRIEHHGDGEAHPEDGRVVALRDVGRLDDGRVEARLHDDVAHVHEDEHDREHAKLVRRQDARHDDLHHEGDGGRPALLEELPEERAYGRGLEV